MRRVLLLGKRARVLERLAAALQDEGIEAVITDDVRRLAASELPTFGAVAFGRAITPERKESVRAAFGFAGADGQVLVAAVRRS